MIDFKFKREDTKLHWLGCFSLTAWCYVAAALFLPLSLPYALGAAAVVAGCVGVTREIVNDTGWSWSDIYADAMGIAAAATIISWSI